MSHLSDGVTVGTERVPHQFYVGPQCWTYAIQPATLDRDGYCAAQQLGGAGDLLLNGALVSAGIGVADVPRCVGIFSAGNLAAVTFTVYGYDMLGVPLVASIAGPSATTVVVPKAFKRITRVAASAAVGTNVEVGTVDRFGLPRRVNDAGMLHGVGWAGAFAKDTATIVVADATSPATASTTDVRGTIQPSSAADGSRRLFVLAHYDLTSRLTELGVTQYGEGLV